jgi:Zn-dependent peptidase ImmA (M78 family)
MLKYKQYLKEQETKSHIDDFMDYCRDYLNVSEMPELVLIPDKAIAAENKSFGGYSPSEKKIYLNTGGRHTADVLRTLAHEMVHHKQNLDGVLTNYAGETGSEFENEANSVAGIIMRNYGKQNPRIYE